MKKAGTWKPREMPALLIGVAARAMSRRDDERLQQVGLRVAQLPVLVALKNGERLTQKALARIAGVEQPSMAQLLARMERDGLIQRTADPADGRSSLVGLTPAALERLEPGRDVLRGGNDEALAGFTPEETDQLLGMLRRILHNLGERD